MEKTEIEEELAKRLSIPERASSAQSFHILESHIYNLESFANYSFTNEYSAQIPIRTKSLQISFLTFLALTLIAILTALIACFIDLVAYSMIKYKKILVFQVENEYLSCIAWVLISLLFIICATSFGYFFAPEADGSGIPEVKAILSGVEMPGYLTLKTLICKVFGLICCSGALSIGKEGPHAHIAAIVAYRVMKIPFFNRLSRHPGVQTQIMESSIAAGVSAVMAAPIGSVFFSMELTATFYMISNIISALYCGLLSSCILLAFRLLNLTEIVKPTHIPKGFNNIDLIVFALIGIIAGVTGVTFTYFTKSLVGYRAKKAIPWLHRRYRYACFITLFYSMTVFFFPPMMLNAKQALNQLLTDKDSIETWNIFGETGTLAAFAFLKMFFTASSTSVQIPGGVFLPVMLSGAAFGRIMYFISEAAGGVANVGMYAAVGGAAFVASTSHSLAVSLIIFEMTGQMHYVVPMLLSVIISYSIGCSLGLSMYDAMIVLKKIQYFPAVRQSKLYRSKAFEVMDHPVLVYLGCSIRQLRDVFFNKSTNKIVLVDENSYILADFSTSAIPKYLKSCLMEYKSLVSAEQFKRIKRNIETENFESGEEGNPFQQSLKDRDSGGHILALDLKRGSSEEDPELPSLKKIDSEKSNLSPNMKKNILDETFQFWSQPVDFTSKILKINKDPVRIQANTPLIRIHYLFLMLGLMQIYITKDFKLVGSIYRHYFTKAK